MSNHYPDSLFDKTLQAYQSRNKGFQFPPEAEDLKKMNKVMEFTTRTKGLMDLYSDPTDPGLLYEMRKIYTDLELPIPDYFNQGLMEN